MTDLSISKAGGFDPVQAKDERLKQAAAQFEALFIQQLMKQGKSFGADENSLFGNTPAEKNYKELLDSALAEQAAGNLGISEAILNQLRVNKSLPDA